ncbi:MAG: hypothetical protein KKG62_00110 [Actinobacteria bacterium]|nr:hypothetical protein [Actinomycetota bacterium]
MPPGKSRVKLPQQELGASFGYKRKTSLSPPSGGLPLHLQTGVWSFMRLNKKPFTDFFCF